MSLSHHFLTQPITERPPICRQRDLLTALDGAEGLDLFGVLEGHDFEPRGEVHPVRLDFYCMIHVYKGAAWFWSESMGRREVTTGQSIWVSPGFIFDVAAATEGAMIDSICFSGSFATHFKADAPLAAGVLNAGVARRLLPVIHFVNEDTHEGYLRARSAWLHLFTELKIEQKKTEAETSRIALLIDAMKHRPEVWRSGKQMAAFCHISEAQLRRIFKKETGLSPKMFQDTVRAEKAAELLEGGFAVHVVSDLLGYSDPFHFSRRYKAIMGKSPREFRSSI